MTQLAVVIVNFNNGELTSNLLKSLKNQTVGSQCFDVFVYDQGSAPEERAFMTDTSVLPDNTFTIQNHRNVPLNHVWNKFMEQFGKNYSYVTFLNNDVLIPATYINSILNVICDMQLSPLVIHTASNIIYQGDDRIIGHTEFCRQGWEFTVKAEHWKPIPKELRFYAGDDFIHKHYHDLLEREPKVWVTLATTATLHLLSQTRRRSRDPEFFSWIRRIAVEDVQWYEKNIGKIVPKLPPLSLLEALPEEIETIKKMIEDSYNVS